jgi:hypothetical protein
MKIIEKFKIFNKLNEEFKRNMKIFQVFRDEEYESNAFIVTNDGMSALLERINLEF